MVQFVTLTWCVKTFLNQFTLTSIVCQKPYMHNTCLDLQCESY